MPRACRRLSTYPKFSERSEPNVQEAVSFTVLAPVAPIDNGHSHFLGKFEIEIGPIRHAES